MRLNFNNVGKGLSAIADAYQTRKIRDQYDTGMKSAEEEAATRNANRDIYEENPDIQQRQGLTVGGLKVDTSGLSQEEINAARGAYANAAAGVGVYAPERDYRDPGMINDINGAPVKGKSWMDGLVVQDRVQYQPGTTDEGVTYQGKGYANKEAIPGYGLNTSGNEQVKVGERSEVSAQDIFAKKFAPGVMREMAKQGKLTEAKAFRDWLNDEKNVAYGEAWTQGMSMIKTDPTGAAKHLQKLYNTMVPDGQYAIVVPGEDGAYEAQIRSEKDDKIIHRTQGTLDDINEMGYGMLNPMARAQASYEAMLKAKSKGKTVHNVPSGGTLHDGEKVVYTNPNAPKSSSTGLKVELQNKDRTAAYLEEILDENGKGTGRYIAKTVYDENGNPVYPKGKAPDPAADNAKNAQADAARSRAEKSQAEAAEVARNARNKRRRDNAMAITGGKGFINPGSSKGFAPKVPAK